jgi:NADH dehydrogenase FAD-containing subunit
MKKQVVIAVGGFVGLYAAKHLDKTIARHAGSAVDQRRELHSVH